MHGNHYSTIRFTGEIYIWLSNLSARLILIICTDCKSLSNHLGVVQSGATTLSERHGLVLLLHLLFKKRDKAQSWCCHTLIRTLGSNWFSQSVNLFTSTKLNKKDYSVFHQLIFIGSASAACTLVLLWKAIGLKLNSMWVLCSPRSTATFLAGVG